MMKILLQVYQSRSAQSLQRIDDLIKFIKDDYKNINLRETREKKLLKLENYLANVTKNATTEIVKHTEELSKNFITFLNPHIT